MSKRYFPQQYGDRKKAKLDVSISDHNFPLSQNNSYNQELNKEDTWGDDNEDEMLLLASQACEEACSNNDISLLANYTICMQPASTSTQVCNQPEPSTSKKSFVFKKPSVNPSSTLSTNLKDKCDRISSPLPGISSKLVQNSQVNPSDDLVFNDKIYKGQDSNIVYQQLLQLQEENAKLKSENGKLLEKCLTKEGEASILRTQLKNCQISVDNARLEKIKAQEKVQMEYNEKLNVANNQMHDLRTQLDFKNLEIISIKEKCKKLESTKLKLTQVTVSGNDISASNRHINNYIQNDFTHKRVKTVCSSVQTEDKLKFLKLNKACRKENNKLDTILPYLLQSSHNQQYSLLDYNEKLQKRTDLSHNKCRIYSTFLRAPSTPLVSTRDCKVQTNTIYEDLCTIAVGDASLDRYFNVFRVVRSVLEDVHSRLETIYRRMTSAFQKEMDEKYIESSNNYLDVTRIELLEGRALYKEEQEILARRMTAVLSYVLETPRGVEFYNNFEEQTDKDGKTGITVIISRVCDLLDSASCATLYSGLLLSVCMLIQMLIPQTNKHTIVDIIKTVITARAMPFVYCNLLRIVKKISLWENFKKTFCPGSNAGNLKIDYDQGVLLCKKDSCYLQTLVKHIEVCLKCIERQNLAESAVTFTRNLLVLHTNTCEGVSYGPDKYSCDCQLSLIQVVVYALRICSVMLNRIKVSFNDSSESPSILNSLLSVCRCGVQCLYRCTIKDVEFPTQLAYNEGHLMEFCEIMKCYEHSEVYSGMLSEVSGSLQCSPDCPSAFHKEAWLHSFNTFTLAD